MWCMHPHTREEQNHHCGSSELALKPLRCLLHEDLHRGYSQSRVQRLSEVAVLRSPTGRGEHVRPHLPTPNSMVLERRTGTACDQGSPSPNNARWHALQRVVHTHRIHRLPRHQLAIHRYQEERVVDSGDRTHTCPTAAIVDGNVPLTTVVKRLWPTSGSWMTLVDVWLGIIDRQVIKRGVYTSVKNLNKRIREFINGWNEPKRPPMQTTTRESVLDTAKSETSSNTGY